jgi:hypothetical protein
MNCMMEALRAARWGPAKQYLGGLSTVAEKCQHNLVDSNFTNA